MVWQQPRGKRHESGNSRRRISNITGAVRLRKNRNTPAFNFDYKTNVFFQKDVGDALTIYDKYYQMLKVG